MTRRTHPVPADSHSGRERGPGRGRRAFLRRAGSLCALSVAGGAVGCLDGSPGVVPYGTTGGSGSTEDAPDLRRGVEVGLVFTSLGGRVGRSAVDPDEPGGGRVVRVDAVDPGERVTLSWRQTVERAVTPTGTRDPGVGTETPTPATHVVEETGTLTATGLAAAHEALLPMYWDPGEHTTDTSAMWLSRGAVRELLDARETDWTGDVLTRISWVGAEAASRIRDGVAAVEDVSLVAEETFVTFEVAVDGRPTVVRAIRAHDSFGNEYVVLASERNPLVLSFTYDAVSVGFTGFDTGLWTLIKTVFSGYRLLSLDTPSR